MCIHYGTGIWVGKESSFQKKTLGTLSSLRNRDEEQSLRLKIIFPRLTTINEAYKYNSKSVSFLQEEEWSVSGPQSLFSLSQQEQKPPLEKRRLWRYLRMSVPIVKFSVWELLPQKSSKCCISGLDLSFLLISRLCCCSVTFNTMRHYMGYS